VNAYRSHVVLVTKLRRRCVFAHDSAINAENAVHRSDKFVTMATRTRQEYLKDLAQNYVSPTLVDSGSRLGLLITYVRFFHSKLISR